MTRSSVRNPSASGRRIVFLGAGIILAIGCYYAGWTFAAQKIQDLLLPPGGRGAGAPEIRCEDPAMRGFPFRIGLFCDKVMVDDINYGLSASFGTLRSAAQVYNPQHIVWEIDGPGVVRSALGLSLASQWESLRASTIFSGTELERVSLESRGLKTSLTETVNDLTIETTSATGQLHMRRNGGDFEAALSLENAVARPRDLAIQLPPANALIDVKIVGQADILDFRGDLHDRLYNSKGELARFALDFGQGRAIEFNGPFSVNGLGLISGSFDVRIAGIASLGDTLATTLPQAAPTIRSAMSILRSLAGGGDSASARINIRDGVIMLSFIPIGTIPPI